MNFSDIQLGKRKKCNTFQKSTVDMDVFFFLFCGF